MLFFSLEVICELPFVLNLAWIVNKQVWLLITEQIEGHGSFNMSLWRGGGGGLVGCQRQEAFLNYACWLLADAPDTVIGVTKTWNVVWIYDGLMMLDLFVERIWLFCPLQIVTKRGALWLGRLHSIVRPLLTARLRWGVNWIAFVWNIVWHTSACNILDETAGYL